MTKTPEHDEALVEQVARLIARITLADMEGADPGDISDERWAEMSCDEDRLYLEQIARAVIPLIRTTDAARIAELERQLVEYQRPTAEQVETFQQACERGFQMPSDPPPWPEMLKLAETFLARATLRSGPDAD